LASLKILFYTKKPAPELIDASENGRINVFIAGESLANYELKEN